MENNDLTVDQKIIKEKNFDQLYKHREFLEKTRINLSISLDKYLLTLAIGILYTSILFTNQLGDNLHYKKILLAGWISILISIISLLLSIVCSIKAHERAVVIDDLAISAYQNDKIVLDCPNWWTRIIDFSESIAQMFFIIGLSLMVYFYFNNL